MFQHHEMNKQSVRREQQSRWWNLPRRTNATLTETWSVVVLVVAGWTTEGEVLTEEEILDGDAARHPHRNDEVDDLWDD